MRAFVKSITRFFSERPSAPPLAREPGRDASVADQLASLAADDRPAGVARCLDAIAAVGADDAGMDALRSFSRRLLNEKRHSFLLALGEGARARDDIAPCLKAIATFFELRTQVERRCFRSVVRLHEIAAAYERDGFYTRGEVSTLAVVVANALLRAGRIDDGLAFIDDRLSTTTAQVELSEIKAVLIAVADPRAAVERLRAARDEAAFKKSARRHSVRLHLAEVESKLGNHDAARTILNDALAEPDAPIEHHLALANNALRSGRRDEQRHAIDRYFEAQGLWSPAAASSGAFGVQAIPSATLAKVEHGPLVSVVMTTFNAAKHVAFAVRSVLEQSYTNFELLIVDDASTDDTREQLAALAASDRRIRILRNATNAGTYLAKNHAIETCAGELVTCHDSDDWWHPQHLERHVARMLERPGLVATKSGWARIDEAGEFSLKRWGVFTHANPASAMIRRHAFADVGYFDAVRTGADVELWSRLERRYGPKAVDEQHICLALGLNHDRSLTTSGATAIDPQGVSRVRLEYWEAWSAWHHDIWLQSRPLAMPASGVRPFPAPPEIAVVAPSMTAGHSGGERTNARARGAETG
jgi:hypothetical protein